MATLRLCLIAAVSFFALQGLGSVAARPALHAFSPELLFRYAGVVRRGELAVVESDATGHARQITLMGHTAAPPALVYRLVADPTRYPRYVRNLTRSTVEKQADGKILNRWKLSFPIGSFEGIDEVKLLPGGPESAAGAVEIHSLGKGKEGLMHWEFFALRHGGTLVVNYGYYDPLDNGFLRKMIGQDPALDAGFNLAGGMALLRSLLAYAEREAQEAGIRAAEPPLEKTPDLGPLLARGTVAIVRSNAMGGLVDVSVVDRIQAPAERLAEMVRDPELLPKAMRSVKRVVVTQRDAKGIEFDLSAAAMLVELVSSFRMLYVPGGCDTLAISGPVKGARFRWDIRAYSPQASTAVWRGNLHLSDANQLLRAMLRIEPSFEHSANLTFGLLSVRSLVRALHSS